VGCSGSPVSVDASRSRPELIASSLQEPQGISGIIMRNTSNLVRVAVSTAIAASALGAATRTALATDVSVYNTAPSTFTNIYLSGSTAIDGTLLNAAIETAGPGGVCLPGTVDVYYIGSNSSYTNRLILCSASGTAGLTASAPLAIFKESVVGSANGVAPLYTVAEGGLSGLTFINPAGISDALCATQAGHPATGDFAAYTDHASCPSSATQTNVIPTAGFADVEADILLTASGSPVDANATKTYLKATGTLDQIWAIALTTNAYYALQAAEGYTSTSDSPLNAPSLSKEEVASLISNDLYYWSDLGLTPPTDNNVYICRRDVGSGTEASFEAYFLGERCGLSSETVPAETPSGQTPYTVWANGSGSGMRSCLKALYAGGTLTQYYNSTVTTTFTAGNQWGIGFLNTEITNSNLTGAGNAFRLVAIDGVGPTVENVQNGYYPYFSTGLSYEITSGAHTISGPQAAFMTALYGKLGHPVFTADSNTNYNGVLPWSNGGTTGDASPGGIYDATNAAMIPATAATAKTNPTNPWIKTSSGGLDNCDTPVWDNSLDGVKTTTVEGKLLGSSTVND
jgi:hypothetical protein